MRLEGAERAAREFVKVMDEARDMATAGATGGVFDELLRHASEVLDMVDEELVDVDRDEHADLFAAAPILRQKLERLRDELRGGMAH